MGTKKGTKKAQASKAEAPAKKAKDTGLVVFAFRLTKEERDAIHEVAGPAKASKFARKLLVAAASRDQDQLKEVFVNWMHSTPTKG